LGESVVHVCVSHVARSGGSGISRSPCMFLKCCALVMQRKSGLRALGCARRIVSVLDSLPSSCKRARQYCSYAGQIMRKWWTVLNAPSHAGHTGESAHFIVNKLSLSGAWPVHSWISRLACFWGSLSMASL
jgi:hypothetical protein